MKNAHRVNETVFLYRKLSELVQHINLELEYAIECYEDGTLSPRRSFQHIRQELEELRDLAKPMWPYETYSVLDQWQSQTQPPATPEAF